MKTVTLPDDVWSKIVRRLTAEVGANDESRKWAGMVGKQTSGAVKASIGRQGGAVSLKAAGRYDLRNSGLVR